MLPIYNRDGNRIVAYREEDAKTIIPIHRITRGRLVRSDIYSVDDILSKVVLPEGRMIVKENFDGDLIKVSSLRLMVFLEKGLTCQRCGVYGLYFAKEKLDTDKTYHMNLYAIDSEGKERLMTKNNIVPINQGGTRDLSNFQTLCESCNCTITNENEKRRKENS